MRKVSIAVAALAVVAFSNSGCSLCEAEEERAVTVNSLGPLVITRNGQTSSVRMGGRVSQAEIARAAFDELFSLIEGGGLAQRGAVLTLKPDQESQDAMMLIAIALPGDLRQGQRLAVGGAFDAPFRLSTESGFGVRTLTVPGRPDVAFRTGSYTFPPATFHTTYAATAAEGFVEVVQRGGEWIQLLLDVTVRNAAGEAVMLRGSVQAQAERYTPPCIS